MKRIVLILPLILLGASLLSHAQSPPIILTSGCSSSYSTGTFSITCTGNTSGSSFTVSWPGCTGTNVVTCSGGGGGSPGSPLNSNQFYLSSGTLGGTAGVLTASPTGGEICSNATGITALIASLANGGTIYVPAGSFTCTPTTSGFGIVNTTESIKLIGAGWDNPLNTAAASTTLLFPAGVVGIDNTGANTLISDMNLVSSDTGANTDDGIRNRGGSNTIERVGIKHFGRNGVLTLGESPITADSWHYSQVQSAENFGDGFQWGTPCTDNHQGVGKLLIASQNAGYGFNLQCTLGSYFESPLAQSNTLGDYNLGAGASYNTFNRTYCETGASSTFTLASGLLGEEIDFNAFGQCQTITNAAGGTAAANLIYWTGLDGWPGYSSLYLLGQPGASGNHSYGFNVGTYATSDLGIYDATAGKWLVNYDPTTYWNFDQPVTVGTLDITGSCIGCLPSSIPIDSEFGTNYTIPSTDAGKLVVSVNTNPVAWTGPTLANNISFTAYNRDPGTVTYTPASGTVNGASSQIIPPMWYGTHYTDNSNAYLLVAPSIGAFPNCSATGSFLNFTTATGVIGCASSVANSNMVATQFAIAGSPTTITSSVAGIGGGTNPLLGTATSPAQGQLFVYNSSGVLVNAYSSINVDPQTGNYTASCPLDRMGEIEFNITSATTLTLPAAGSTACLSSNVGFVVRNTPTSIATLTIAATTSVFLPENVASHTADPGASWFIYSDNANYHAIEVPPLFGKVNLQTASYTALPSDVSKMIVMNCASACVLTLPATPPNGSWTTWVLSIGSTLATVSLNGLNFNGSATAPTLATGHAIQIRTDATNWYGDISASTGAGTGTVTHASGALTAGQVMLGNGAADATVDPDVSTNGAGAMTAASYTTSGTNGGVTGAEGTGASAPNISTTNFDNLIPCSVTGTYCPFAHRWSMINNAGTPMTPAGVASAATSGHVAAFASNGVDLVDGGAPGTGTVTGVTGTSPVASSGGAAPAISINANGITATQLAAQYSKGSCTEVWVGSGTSSALSTGDDAVSNNTCYNDSGVTRTITAVKCRNDNASNTTTVNPTFGSAGTGTTILSGALTCGSSYAYSSTGTVSSASWTTGSGIDPGMGGTLTGTSIAMIVEFTY